MILGFKPQFEPLILSGTKIHTIREDKHNRWKPGIKIQMSTGVRTKNYECFYDKYTCVSTQKIHMIRFNFELVPSIYIDDSVFPRHRYEELSKNDGFSSLNEFCEWFSMEEFVGNIIHWTPFKYAV